VSYVALAKAIVLGAYELGSELWHEHRREQARQRARDAWANTPAPIRACARCSEIAYTPGQVACNRCGSVLR